VFEVLYLIIASLGLSFAEVRLDRGRLTLSGLALGAAAILLNPLNATLAGAAIAIGMGRRGAWPILANGLTMAASTCAAAVVASGLHDHIHSFRGEAGGHYDHQFLELGAGWFGDVVTNR
jgi:hypothetical protein